MNGNVNLYDTYKANKDGKRYRVTEVGNETVKLVKLNEDGSKKHAGGRPRIMTVADLFRDFTKVNLPPVTVSKIEPQKPKQEEVEEVGTPSENAAEKQKQTVREINHPEAHTLEDTFEEFREKNQSNVKNVTVTVDGREIREQITHEKELDVLKAELKEKLQEGIDLKERLTSSIKEREKADRTVAEQRKTISKMHDTIAGLRSAGVKWQAAQRRCEELEKENDMLAKNLSELQQQVEKRNADAAAFLTSDELDIAMSYIDGAMTDPRDDKSGMTQAIAALDVILTLARGRTK